MFVWLAGASLMVKSSTQLWASRVREEFQLREVQGGEVLRLPADFRRYSNQNPS